MAATKHLINSVDDAVPESLTGLCLAYPHLQFHDAHKVVLAPNYNARIDKVAIVCGGGSGHEPFAAGFVGDGMLTASVAGSIFAAPPSRHITYALQRVSEGNKAGVLVVIPNYTGDRLNFGIAIQKARKSQINVADIIVDDDCSIPQEQQNSIGKRGLIGLLFVIKVAGALAERGIALHEICLTLKIVTENMATYAVGLTACSIPGQGLMFNMAEDEMECGMGVHGEAGYERTKLKSASDVVKLILQRICNALPLVKGDSVAAMVNNLGALSQLEQGIVVYELVTQLKAMGVQVVRVYSGILMTCLNSSGIHVCLLKLLEEHQATLIRCLDDPTKAPKWPGNAYSMPVQHQNSTSNISEYRNEIKIEGRSVDEWIVPLIKSCLENACAAVIEKEGYINELDLGCGDGDCGSTLKRFAEGILRNLGDLVLSHPATLLSQLANIAEETMGGTSGALYCLFFTSAVEYFFSIHGATSQRQEVDPKQWQELWFHIYNAALSSLSNYAKAQPGDRTMLDTMFAVLEAYQTALKTKTFIIYEEIINAAWRGCEATKNMKPRAGRASYVKQSQYLQRVDAGAYAAATWISSIAKTVQNFENQK